MAGNTFQEVTKGDFCQFYTCVDQIMGLYASNFRNEKQERVLPVELNAFSLLICLGFKRKWQVNHTVQSSFH